MSSEMRYFPSSADDDGDEQEPSGYPRMGSTPNIADRFADLLAPLSDRWSNPAPSSRSPQVRSSRSRISASSLRECTSSFV